MYQLTISDKTRRYIGDALLAADFHSTVPISGISAATGISRVTLTKWVNSDYRLWWLSKHISDDHLRRLSYHSPYAHDSRFFRHAQAYAQRVMVFRRRATSGELGPDIQKAELDRKHNENAARKN